MTALCAFCSSPTTEVTFTEEVEADGFLVRITGISGERCTVCGKTCISRSEAERIREKIDREIERRKRGPAITGMRLGFKKDT